MSEFVSPNPRPTRRRGSYYLTDLSNPHGLHLTLQFRQDDERHIAYVAFLLPDYVEGPPGHAHGGIPATIIDELMGTAAWFAGFKVVTANMSFDYHLPVPLNTPLTAEGWVVKSEGKKITTAGKLCLTDGRAAVSGQGLFIHAPHLFNNGK
jgi:acyl-coenzyme A thioesterase PaaI-like protein